MFYDSFHLTPAARESLTAAEEAAVLLNQSYVGTEHLLLGLIRTDSGTAEVLRRHEVTEKRVLELYRAASAALRKDAEAVLKGTKKVQDEDAGSDLLGSVLGGALDVLTNLGKK